MASFHCSSSYGVAIFGKWNLPQINSVLHICLHWLHEWNLIDDRVLLVWVAILPPISISTCCIQHSTNVYWTWIWINLINLISLSEDPGKLSLNVRRGNFCAFMKWQWTSVRQLSQLHKIAWNSCISFLKHRVAWHRSWGEACLLFSPWDTAYKGVSLSNLFHWIQFPH